MFTSLSSLSDTQKQELIASLASILAASSEGGVEADKLEAIATAAGCSLSGAYASLFAQVMANGDLKKLCAGPGSGGGGGGGGGGGAAGDAPAAAAKEEEKEEEEEMDLGGGMDMFGGDEGGGGGGDY